jgi:hypothetical protein
MRRQGGPEAVSQGGNDLPLPIDAPEARYRRSATLSATPHRWPMLACKQIWPQIIVRHCWRRSSFVAVFQAVFFSDLVIHIEI